MDPNLANRLEHEKSTYCRTLCFQGTQLIIYSVILVVDNNVAVRIYELYPALGWFVRLNMLLLVIEVVGAFMMRREITP